VEAARDDSEVVRSRAVGRRPRAEVDTAVLVRLRGDEEGG
jgi:hypothetical protein